MHTYHLRCEMLVKESISEVFKFFEDARNLSQITPPWLNFRVLSDKVEMRPGAEIDYRIKLMGLPMNWKTLITEYEPPFEFTDEQAIGPYRYWRHRHTFRPTDNGTLVGDHVEYALPFGSVGRLAHAVMVRRQLMAIFTYRQTALSQHFSGNTINMQEPVIAAK